MSTRPKTVVPRIYVRNTMNVTPSAPRTAVTTRKLTRRPGALHRLLHSPFVADLRANSELAVYVLAAIGSLLLAFATRGMAWI